MLINECRLELVSLPTLGRNVIVFFLVDIIKNLECGRTFRVTIKGRKRATAR